MTSSTLAKSSNKKSGWNVESFWRGQEPVATAMVRAPNALPQAMSCPVSPMTSICAASNSWPCFSCARAGERAELVAIVMIVGERAELEEVPETVALQFQLRAACDVAREQGENAIRFCFHTSEDFGDAGKNLAVQLRQQTREKIDIFIEKVPTFSFVAAPPYFFKMSAAMLASVFPAISMSSRSSCAPYRFSMTNCNALNPAPPVLTSVESMSKRRRRFCIADWCCTDRAG